jgi:hypothetical protein
MDLLYQSLDERFLCALLIKDNFWLRGQLFISASRCRAAERFFAFSE